RERRDTELEGRSGQPNESCRKKHHERNERTEKYKNYEDDRHQEKTPPPQKRGDLFFLRFVHQIVARPCKNPWIGRLENVALSEGLKRCLVSCFVPSGHFNLPMGASAPKFESLRDDR